MSATENQPDWDKIGEKFDMWLPQIAPVAEVLLQHLEAQPGDRIIDLACGTGEPALTLARRMGGEVEIVGVDAAEGMITVARGKAEQEELRGISFATMPAEALEMETNSFDRAICRFGVMLFNDPLQGLKEMYRVLKPGGRFSIAVWHTPKTMPTLDWSFQVMSTRLPEDLHPPLAKATSLGGPDVLESLLSQAGFSDFHIDTNSFDYEFDSFDDYWDLVEDSDILKMQFDALPEADRASIRDEVGQLAQDFIVNDRLVAPHHYRVAYGNK